jgi:carbonic anhydrase
MVFRRGETTGAPSGEVGVTPKRDPRGRVQVPKRPGGQPPPSALDRLRTVEFRQTLRGYHIDDVDRYLEAVAAEVDALPSRTPATGGAAPDRFWASTVVLTCMDPRLEASPALRHGAGHALVIRNAGGIATDDVIRSLAVSERRKQTTRILVVQHTDCALLGLDEAAFLEQVRLDTGSAPPWRAGAFSDVVSSVRQTCVALRDSPFLSVKDGVRGFVYDVTHGTITEVQPMGTPVSNGAGHAPGQAAWSGWW